MDTEHECPDCGTLHYAPTLVKCDCRASCDWGYCSKTASESAQRDGETRPYCAEHGALNRLMLRSIAAARRSSRERCASHVATCPCHDCFTSRDGQAR